MDVVIGTEPVSVDDGAADVGREGPREQAPKTGPAHACQVADGHVPAAPEIGQRRQNVLDSAGRIAGIVGVEVRRAGVPATGVRRRSTDEERADGQDPLTPAQQVGHRPAGRAVFGVGEGVVASRVHQ